MLACQRTAATCVACMKGSVIFAEIGIQMFCRHSPRLGYNTKDLLNFYGYDNIKCLNQRGEKSSKFGSKICLLL